MFELPDSTLFNRRIPKLKFYQRAAITTQLKRVFTEQISLILWQNKLAPSTLNVAAGQTVTEIQVIRIKLNQRSLDADALALIEKEIPYHLLFLLEYADAVQAWISYKDETGALKSGVTYHTEWIPEEALPLKLDGCQWMRCMRILCARSPARSSWPRRTLRWQMSSYKPSAGRSC